MSEKTTKAVSIVVEKASEKALPAKNLQLKA